MTHFKMALKSLLANFVYHSGMFKQRLNRLSKDQYVILMYHRIIPQSEGGRFLHPGMYVEPNTFDAHLCFLKQNFDIRPVDKLFAQDISVQKRDPNKCPCYLTFDDGWSDFYKYAFPILVKHKIPATVFLPTGFIGTNDFFWTERLGHFFSQLDHLRCFVEFKSLAASLLANNNLLYSKTPEQLLVDMISELKEMHEEQINDFIGKIEGAYDIQPVLFSNDFLNWEEVEEMHNSGLVSFGSHTVTHRILTNLDEEQVCRELRDSKSCLLDHNIVKEGRISFCYPNGGYNEKISNSVKDEGYFCAFSTCSGFNNNKSPRYSLKRLPVHQDISSSIPLLAYRFFYNAVNEKYS